MTYPDFGSSEEADRDATSGPANSASADTPPSGPTVSQSAADGPDAAQRALVVKAEADDGSTDRPEAGSRPVTELVEQPAKVMRIGSMIKQLLDEVRSAPLDEASRTRLKEIYETSIVELEDGLAPELVDELHRLALPFSGNATPSEAELRIVQAQLVGWLEGLFHGIQTALFAQQMQAQAQLEEMRRRAVGPGPEDHSPHGSANPASGPYL